MTSIIDKSFLSNNKYQFVINRLPNLVFYTQSVEVPGLTLSTVNTPSPYVTLPVAGQQLTFSQLTINYVMDEDFDAWFEIYDWMMSMGNPTSLNKLGNLTTTPGKSNSISSDATLIVKTNSNNANIRFDFKDVFPTELAGFTLTSTEGQDFISSSVTFTYTYYHASRIIT